MRQHYQTKLFFPLPSLLHSSLTTIHLFLQLSYSLEPLELSVVPPASRYGSRVHPARFICWVATPLKNLGFAANVPEANMRVLVGDLAARLRSGVLLPTYQLHIHRHSRQRASSRGAL